MSYWYARAAVELRILPEDFKLISDASLQKPYRVFVTPRDVTVNVNDYKTTDTFQIEMDYKNFPFDPRTIRACGVVIYMQDLQRNYNPDGTVAKLVPTEKNSVLSGFVDKDHIEFDDTKRTVRFEGRDYTALLIDQKYQTNSPISLNQKLDEAITTLLAAFKATAQITVVNNTGGELPTLAKYYPGFGDPMAGQKNVGAHETYWEIIQDLVNRAGLICFIHLDKLILTTPKNQLLAPGQSETVDDIRIVYGKNVKNLKLERKLGRFKGFNLQVRSRVGKTVLTAKIPEEATKEWGTGFGFQYQPAVDAKTGESINFSPVRIPQLKPDGSVDPNQAQQVAPYITFPVPNVGDKDALIRIAQTTYEQYSLQQLEGSFDTFEMLGRGTTKDSSIDKKKSFKNYDLTQIAKGQTVCIEIDSDDLSKISRLDSIQERTNYLIRRSYDKTVASIFAKTMGKFSPRFQIKSYSMSINQDNGWKLSVQFQNIVDTTLAGLT